MSDFDFSYEGALAAAGAIVHAFEHFGAYQGEWWAKVTYGGETGWVNGYYGSCSGCDALEAEFGYDFDKVDRERFAEFGRSYLEDMVLSQEEAEKKAATNLDWDMEAKNMLAFIQSHA